MAGSGGANASTHFIGSVAYSDNTTYSYSYDAVGNITEIKKNGTTIRSYVYDELNQLIRENNHELLQYVCYTHDYSGNIQSKTRHYWAGVVIEETSYTYGNTQWGDLLTNYNGTDISYDASGNPLNWRNAAILNWQGRRLNGIALDSGYIHGLDFKYNADGIRIKKSYYDHSNKNMYSITYALDGTKILSQTYKHSFTGETYTVKFFYDANDAPIAMEYGGNYYYFRTNIQGDIEGIYNANGTLVVSYSYDAWGNILSTTGTLASTVGEINPFRYRGYYYDTETGWYYLQSRYYDPTVGRFPNADSRFDNSNVFLTCNIYMYCVCNPINAIDCSGKDAIWLQDTGSVCYLGHTGVLLEDSNGRWWHFYWGSDNKSSSSGKTNRTVVEYKGRLNLRDINKFYREINPGKDYEKMIRFTGDFSGSVSFIKRYQNNKSYNFLLKNCVQMSVNALQYGKFEFSNTAYQAFMLKLTINPIPNIAYERMATFHSAINAWHSALWYSRIGLVSPAVAVIIF